MCLKRKTEGVTATKTETAMKPTTDTLHSISLRLTNNKAYPLTVSMFKGLNYTCLPLADCVEIDEGGGIGSYDFILTDILANEIKISKMKVVFAGNPNQARYSFRERFQSSTGTEAARSINVQSHMTAMQKDNTIADIELSRPIKVGNKRFLDYTVDANTTVDVVFFFQYSDEKKDNEFRNFVTTEKDKRKREREEREKYLRSGYTGFQIM
jgi:hypothetical protein